MLTDLQALAEPGGIYALVEFKGRRYFIGQAVNYKQIEDVLAEYLKISGVCAFATDRRGSMSINGLKADLDKIL